MILLCGIPSEAPLRLAILAAENLGVEYVLLNQIDLQNTDLSLRINGGKISGKLAIHDAEWSLTGFTGIYARLMNYQDLPEFEAQSRDPENAHLALKSALFHEAIVDWLEVTDCQVMNRFSSMNSNFSKPYQTQLISKMGFLTPPTLITNNQEEVTKFLRHHKKVVYKSISSERSIVKKLGDVKMMNLKNIRYLPTQFQAFIPGTNVRVHVAGGEAFPTEVRSEAIDYRYSSDEGLNLELAPTKLPPEIEKRCIRLSQFLQLPLCGIDLKLTPEGKYYCFEVNPSPGYSFYQEKTGQDIASAIVNYLNRKCRKQKS
jgi:hypothetical protein